jgi:hypothetical protein
VLPSFFARLTAPRPWLLCGVLSGSLKTPELPPSSTFLWKTLVSIQYLCDCLSHSPSIRGSSTNPGPSAPPLVITVIASASLQPNIPPPEPGATPPKDAPPTTPRAANTHHLPLHCFLDFSELPSTTSSSPPTSSSRIRTFVLLDDRLTAPFYRCSNLHRRAALAPKIPPTLVRRPQEIKLRSCFRDIA